jgi:hypothetical protein
MYQPISLIAAREASADLGENCVRITGVWSLGTAGRLWYAPRAAALFVPAA